MQASLEPVVEQPVAVRPSLAHSSASMLTQRRSISAVWGYSSLSTRLRSAAASMSSRASGSIHVVTNVARFSRGLPSRMSSSSTS